VYTTPIEVIFAFSSHKHLCMCVCVNRETWVLKSSGCPQTSTMSCWHTVYARSVCQNCNSRLL